MESLVNIEWRTSTACEFSNCVQVGFWTRASTCADSQCLEVSGTLDGGVLLRDSKDPEGGVLAFTREEWTQFLAGARKGDFDLP